MNAANPLFVRSLVSVKLGAGFFPRLIAVWGLFLGLSSLYCYSYALVVDGDYATNLSAALQCVAQDWLVWAALSPALIWTAHRQSLSKRQGQVRLVGLLIFCTLLVGSYRILLEMALGTQSAMAVLLIYLPRYFFIATLIALGGLFYTYKTRADRMTQWYETALDQLLDAAAPAQPLEAEKKLVATKGQANVLVPLKDILSINASGNYLELVTRDNCYLMRNTMKNIQPQLDPQKFVRVHRSHIVNLDEVVSASRAKMEVMLSNGQALRLGQTYLGNLPHFNETREKVRETAKA